MITQGYYQQDPIIPLCEITEMQQRLFLARQRVMFEEIKAMQQLISNAMVLLLDAVHINAQPLFFDRDYHEINIIDILAWNQILLTNRANDILGEAI